jgi:GT2 family glycosyltransferase
MESLAAALLQRLATHVRANSWQTEFDAAFRADNRARRKVSIIVPVYDDADSLHRLTSLDCFFDEADAIFFVDDRSDSTAVKDLLVRASRRGEKVRVLRNERNLGFTESVNRGFQARDPSHDVVLLNTDAIPSSGWLEHLQMTAYSRPDVASVTPLTNSAGYCSIPRPGVSNPLPSRASIAECDALLGWLAPRYTEAVMAGCGFCWYVTATAIRQTGLLDERLYYRGYCEETDFCRRATEHGMVHLCLLTAYVGHVGHTSFASSQSRLRLINVPTLHAVRPDFQRSRQEYVSQSCLSELGPEFADFLDRIGRINHTPLAPEAIVISDEQVLPDRVLGLQSTEAKRTSLRFAGQQCSVPIPSEQLQRFHDYLLLRFGLHE